MDKYYVLVSYFVSRPHDSEMFRYDADEGHAEPCRLVGRPFFLPPPPKKVGHSHLWPPELKLIPTHTHFRREWFGSKEKRKGSIRGAEEALEREAEEMVE